MNKILVALLILVGISLFVISKTDLIGSILNDILVVLALILLFTMFFLSKRDK